MNKRYAAIKNRLSRKDQIHLAIWQHPHRKSLKYYPYSVGLTRKPNMHETIWLNKYTTANYSIDHTMAPYNLSFQNKRDAMHFKLVWHGPLACDKHSTF